MSASSSSPLGALPRFSEGPDAQPPRQRRALRGRDGIEPAADSRGESGAARAPGLPALLVRGRMSDLLGEEGAGELLDPVRHAHSVGVSGAGHMVAGDRNDESTQCVIDFLRDHVSRAGE